MTELSGRLIPQTIAPAATHMAIDAWLLEQLRQGDQPPTLRFYQWSPAALSLGYHQRRWPEHWRHLHWQDRPVELVRRPTGGRAVLHQGDFTYSLTLPVIPGRQRALYQKICDGLVAAWQTLGVLLQYGTAGREYRHQPNCFALATPADLVTPSGYKLVGSAQVRRDRALLQQGTFRLWPDPALHQAVFGEPLPAATVPPEIPEAVSDDWLSVLSGLIVKALSQSLGITFKPQPLSPLEIEQALAACGRQGTIQ